MDGFKRIGILGMGLIGGSIALGLKKANYQGKIIGFDLNRAALQEALQKGAVDTIAFTVEEAVKEADLILLAVPVGFYKSILEAIGPLLQDGVVVTDVGSVKGHVVSLMKKHLPPGVHFIGGHPMAGSEQGGFSSATPTLFQNAYYFLTKSEEGPPRALAQLHQLVKLLGAYPVVVDPNEHDQIVATISHVPHLAAVLLVNLLEVEKQENYASFAGGGFRDTTRIASGNPHMWKDIFLYNKKEMLKGIEKLEGCLQKMKIHLAAEDETQILSLLERAKHHRDQLPHHRSNYILPLYEIVVDVDDRPGALGELTVLLGQNQINIKEIEILRAREGEMGAIKVGFEREEDELNALAVLQLGKFQLISQRGVKVNVENERN